MVFSKDWFLQHQGKLLWLLNTPLIKVWFRWVMRIRKEDLPLKTEILEFGPNHFTHSAKLKGDQVELQTSFRSNEKYARRLWFAFEPLWWAMHFWDWLTRPWPSLNLSFDTLPTKYSTPGSTVSGYSKRGAVNETFATIIGGAGNGYSYDGTVDAFIRVMLSATSTSNQYSSLQRGIFLFDASALGASATVTAAAIGLYGAGYNPTDLGTGFDIDIVASTPASDTVLANGDYGNLGSTPFSSVASASLSLSNYTSFTLDASGRANISKTGISKFGARINWDTDGSFGGTWASSAESGANFQDGSYAGTTRDPKIDITYTLPASGPVNLKTWGDIAKASVKTFNDIAIASVKTWDGVA